MDTSAPPQTADLLVQHALLITQDAQRRVIEDGALAIRDGRLLAVGPTAEIAPRFAARRSLDGFSHSGARHGDANSFRRHGTAA